MHSVNSPKIPSKSPAISSVQPAAGLVTSSTTVIRKSFPQSLAGMNTPQLMKVGLGAIWLSASLLALAVTNVTNAQKGAFKVLQKESTPSILNARRIKDSLADMDALAANELLETIGMEQLKQEDLINSASAIRQSQKKGAITTDPDSIDLVLINPTNNEFDQSEGFEYRQNRLAGWLVKASQNITYPEEWQPIWQIQYGIQNYAELIQRAKMLNSQGNKIETMRVYRQATDLMDEILLPAADRLAAVNKKELDGQYADQRRLTAINLTFMSLATVMLLGSLIGLQWFLYKRTNRVINPLLAIATIGSIAYIFNIFLSIGTANQSLKVASQDAFESLDALSNLRSTSYMANASESRYLLELNNLGKSDQSQADRHEQDFVQRSQKVSGLLNKALGNITFKGEEAALQKTVKNWQRYNAIDQQIRTLAKQGNLAAAIALCIGRSEGQSNWAFEAFRGAQRETTELNQKAFDQAIDRGNQRLAPLTFLTPTVCLGVMGLAFFGCLPRLREYSR
jgi:hypothetical protein